MAGHEIPFLRPFVGARKCLPRFALICVALFVASASIYESVRLYRIHSQNSADIFKPVPVVMMPFVSPERDWMICHYGGLRFSIPSSLGSNMTIKRGTPFLEFGDGTNRVQVSGAVATPTSVRQSRMSLRESMPPELKKLSYVKLKIVAHQGSENPATQRWLDEMGAWFRLGGGLKAEYIEKKEWEGLLHYRRNGFYTLEWESKDEAAGGTIAFKASSSDINWIRALCHSLTLENQPVPLEELRASPEKFLRMEQNVLRIVE